MTRQELMLHMLGVILNLAIAVERIAEAPADKQRASQLQEKLDQWLALYIVSP